jgi:hypothetical protein
MDIHYASTPPLQTVPESLDASGWFDLRRIRENGRDLKSMEEKRRPSELQMSQACSKSLHSLHFTEQTSRGMV